VEANPGRTEILGGVVGERGDIRARPRLARPRKRGELAALPRERRRTEMHPERGILLVENRPRGLIVETDHWSRRDCRRDRQRHDAQDAYEPCDHPPPVETPLHPRTLPSTASQSPPPKRV